MDRLERTSVALLLALFVIVLLVAALVLGTSKRSTESPEQRRSAPETRAQSETAGERLVRLLGGPPAQWTPISAPRTAPQVTERLIPQYRAGGDARVYRARPDGWRPTAIVMHASGSGAPGSEFGSLAKLQRFFARPAARSSAHYGVDRQGRVMRYVADDQAAFHTATPGWNDLSIGIELLNDNSGEQPFPPGQMRAVTRLVRHLASTYSIPAEAIVRHRDVQPEDRADPPRNFPWQTWVGSLG